MRHWLTASVLLSALSVTAAATPIQPNVEKLLSKPHPAQEWFEPARAGWDGSETQAGAARSGFALEEFGPAETARMVRASFIAAAVPDPRIWAGLCALILLFRRRRQATPKLPEASESSKVELRRAA